jgi:transcription antitermination factor NusB
MQQNAAKRNKKPDSIRRKSAAREEVIRSLYASHFNVSDDTKKWPTIPEAPRHVVHGAPADQHHVLRVLEGVRAQAVDLDQVISSHLSSEWRLDRLSVPLLALLRAGAYELLMLPEIPKNAIIDEYVTLAQHYCDESEAKFVNGFLERVGNEARQKLTTNIVE